MNEVINIAQLTNVRLLAAAVEKSLGRPQHLPGLLTFHGPSGYGKTTAAAYVANTHRAYHVECRSTWTRRYLCEQILAQMGIAAARTTPRMVDQISDQLGASGRPLIVDEADYVVDKGWVDLVRDIYAGCQGTIVLVGEEKLPTKLLAYERTHGRMLDWIRAEPASLADAKALARLFAGHIEIGDDLLADLVEKSAGSARRIVVNLEQLLQLSARKRKDKLTLDDWTGQEWFTGQPPAMRARPKRAGKPQLASVG